MHAMSLAFLSKKTWHVTNFSNQEAVWKAEKAKAEEEKKMEEWKKKQEEDRQIMELKRLQRESGQAPQGGAAKERERVDFLYEVPATKKEEYLLGKPVDIVPEESDVKKVEHLPGSNFLAVGQNNLSSAANEEFNKMNNDPLVAMRLEEQKALQRIMNNPIKLKQIRGAVEERREAILGSSDDPGQDRRHGKHKKEHHKHKKEKHRHRKEGKEKHRHKSSSHRESKRRRGDSDSGSDSNSDDRAPSLAAPREKMPGEMPGAREHDDDGGRRVIQKKAGFGLQMYSAGTKVMGSHIGGSGTDSGAASSGAASSTHDDFEAAASFEGPRPGWIFQSGPQGVGYYRDASHTTSHAPAKPAAAPAAAPAAVSLSATTRGAASASSSRRPVPAPPHQQRRQPLSAAEKEERLRQMMTDADAHDGERRKRSKIDDERVAAEQADLQAAATAASADTADGRGPSFVREMAKSVAGQSSVAEQVNQQKHYMQRGRSGDAESFMRR